MPQRMNTQKQKTHLACILSVTLIALCAGCRSSGPVVVSVPTNGGTLIDRANIVQPSQNEPRRPHWHDEPTAPQPDWYFANDPDCGLCKSTVNAADGSEPPNWYTRAVDHGSVYGPILLSPYDVRSPIILARAFIPKGETEFDPDNGLERLGPKHAFAALRVMWGLLTDDAKSAIASYSANPKDNDARDEFLRLVLGDFNHAITSTRLIEIPDPSGGSGRNCLSPFHCLMSNLGSSHETEVKDLALELIGSGDARDMHHARLNRLCLELLFPAAIYRSSSALYLLKSQGFPRVTDRGRGEINRLSLKPGDIVTLTETTGLPMNIGDLADPAAVNPMVEGLPLTTVRNIPIRRISTRSRHNLSDAEEYLMSRFIMGNSGKLKPSIKSSWEIQVPMPDQGVELREQYSDFRVGYFNALMSPSVAKFYVQRRGDGFENYDALAGASMLSLLLHMTSDCVWGNPWESDQLQNLKHGDVLPPYWLYGLEHLNIVRVLEEQTQNITGKPIQANPDQRQFGQFGGGDSPGSILGKDSYYYRNDDDAGQRSPLGYDIQIEPKEETVTWGYVGDNNRPWSLQEWEDSGILGYVEPPVRSVTFHLSEKRADELNAEAARLGWQLKFKHYYLFYEGNNEVEVLPPKSNAVPTVALTRDSAGPTWRLTLTGYAAGARRSQLSMSYQDFCELAYGARLWNSKELLAALEDTIIGFRLSANPDQHVLLRDDLPDDDTSRSPTSAYWSDERGLVIHPVARQHRTRTAWCERRPFLESISAWALSVYAWEMMGLPSPAVTCRITAVRLPGYGHVEIKNFAENDECFLDLADDGNGRTRLYPYRYFERANGGDWVHGIPEKGERVFMFPDALDYLTHRDVLGVTGMTREELTREDSIQ